MHASHLINLEISNRLFTNMLYYYLENHSPAPREMYLTKVESNRRVKAIFLVTYDH